MHGYWIRLFLGFVLEGTALRTQRSVCGPEGRCDGGRCQEPLTTPARLYNLSENFKGRGLLGGGANATQAVCTFTPPPDLVNVSHAPHAAQFLYKCWSWWRTHPQAEPVFLDTPTKGGSTRGPMTVLMHEHADETTKGILQSLRWSGVKMTSKKSSVKADAVVEAVRHGGWPGDEEQWFLEEGHARDFRDEVLAYVRGEKPLGLLRAAPGDLRRSHAVRPREQPRIGLLQREGARKLAGQEAILAALRRLGLGPVDSATFEGKSFAEQVEFMNGHDIVISPHGAQLTSTPFMPDCGGMLEIYPRFYWIPGFFGTMARNSGVDHMAFYASPRDPSEGKLTATSNIMRNLAKYEDICAPVEQIVAAVQELVTRRERCVARWGSK